MQSIICLNEKNLKRTGLLLNIIGPPCPTEKDSIQSNGCQIRGGAISKESPAISLVEKDAAFSISRAYPHDSIEKRYFKTPS